VDDEDVAGQGRFNVERTGLRIAAEHALNAVMVVAAGVDGRGVDRVSGLTVRTGWLKGENWR